MTAAAAVAGNIQLKNKPLLILWKEGTNDHTLTIKYKNNEPI